jgi:hypothetical protein
MLAARLVVHHRLRCVAKIVAVTLIHIVLIDRVPVAVLVFATLLVLEAVLHLGLRCSNDAVIVFRVLQVVFGHDAVACAMRIASKGRILFSDMLSGAADFYIRAGAVVGPAERIAALAIEIVIPTVAAAAIAATATAAATPPTALVLLSWPHKSFTNSLSSLIKGHAACRSSPDQDFACHAQVDQRGLPLSKSNYLITHWICSTRSAFEKSRFSG